MTPVAKNRAIECVYVIIMNSIGRFIMLNKLIIGSALITLALTANVQAKGPGGGAGFGNSNRGPE